MACLVAATVGNVTSRSGSSRSRHAVLPSSETTIWRNAPAKWLAMAAKRTWAPPTAKVGKACSTSGAAGPSRVCRAGSFTLTYLRSSADTDGHDPAVPYRNRFRRRNALHHDPRRCAGADGGAGPRVEGAEPGGDG